MKALFIHRSVGHHLIEQGDLRSLLKNTDINLDDYDNNTGILTKSDGHTQNNMFSMPGNNTNPDNLARFFAAWLDMLDNYDLVIIKSCYPNSHIKNELQLKKVKENYTSILMSFLHHKKKILILTTPPLRPLMTNRTEAKLSGDLADWLVSHSGDNVSVFDFHRLLSEEQGRHKGMLKRQYRRLQPFDNHPNRKAHQEIAPMLAELLSGS